MRKSIIYVVTVFWLALTFIPISWILMMSFMMRLAWTPGTAISYEALEFTWDNYVVLFTGGFIPGVESVIRPLINSVVISFSGAGLALLCGVPAGYAVSRWRTGGTFMSSLILGFRMFPPIVILIPFMMLYAAIRLYDTHIGVILFYGLANLPFGLWLMKSFFDDIPKDVDEAAMLDGCTYFGAFRKVILPMAKSGLITTVLFVFLLVWNDYIGVLVLASSQAITIPFYIGKASMDYAGTLYGIIGAIGLVETIPVFIFVRYLQKHLVRGLTFGAVKGRK